MVPECPVEEDEEADAEVPDPVGPALNGPSSTAKGKSKAAKPVVPKAKKQTVASLASTLDGLAQALPALTAQMSELASRTQKMEEAMAGGQRSSALKQPLGSLTTGGSAQPSLPISSLLHEMPAPRLVRPKVLQLAPPPGPHQNLEQRGSPADLTQAVLAQSSALTALVGQIAAISGDPLQDLAGGTSTLSSRGATGRAKLQQELAAQKGIFYTSILQTMARRMNPSMSSNATRPMELLSRGVTATRYVERYGGYGKCRDIGQIMWQVSIILDHIQAENWNAVKDSVALLALCLEQTALDNGQMPVIKQQGWTHRTCWIFSPRSMRTTPRTSFCGPTPPTLCGRG